MGQVVDLVALQNDKWEADFKARWAGRSANTDEIWAIQEWLEGLGWSVTLYDKQLPEFHTFVDYTNKVLRNNNVKAYHARLALRAVAANVMVNERGRVLFYWEEIRDEAHRNVRDQEEWKGTELYGTVWYDRELHSREMEDDEEPPVVDHSDAIIHPDETK